MNADHRSLPSALTADQLRERAAEFRQMAASATTAQVRDSLIRVAERYEALAVTREGGT